MTPNPLHRPRRQSDVSPLNAPGLFIGGKVSGKVEPPVDAFDFPMSAEIMKVGGIAGTEDRRQLESLVCGSRCGQFTQNQHAVEGIAMFAGKQTRSLAVFNGDGEFMKAQLPDADRKVFRHLSRLGKFADPEFCGHLPGGSGADK